ncbi:MAG: hypothetical protein AAGA56_30470, partial [Myxococcota bacterium]
MDAGLALSGLHWAYLAATRHADPTHPVVATLIALNLTVAGLFTFRRLPDAKAPGLGTGGGIACLLSVASAGFVLKMAPPIDQWSTGASLAFAAAGACAILSLVTLGRSFAVLPSRRGLVRRGPYRLVRHPAYCAELTMVAVAAGEGGSLSSLAGFL